MLAFTKNDVAFGPYYPSKFLYENHIYKTTYNFIKECTTFTDTPVLE